MGKEKTSLPDGWEMKKLIELGEVQTGTTPSTKNKEFYGNFIPFVKPPHFNTNGTIDFNNPGLSEKGIAKGRLIKKNSILMVCIGASIGKTGITPIPISCNQQINSFTPKENCSPKFFYHLLSSDYFFKKVIKLSSQATLPMINKTKWQNIEIPLPPLPQQKQIVAILDKSFAAIETAKANAEQNLQNAKELFESYLQNVFENKGDDWEEKTLGEILQKTETVNPKLTPESEFTYIDVSSVNKQTKLIEKTTALLGKDAPSRARKLVKTNDVIFATVRPTHSRVAIITENYNNQVCSTGYYVLRPKPFIENHFVFYFILTYGFNKLMESMQKGASYPAVNNKEVESVSICFPKSKKEQKQIVKKLNALSAETKKLEAIYSQKIADLEELKKSVLQKAFSGQLSK